MIDALVESGVTIPLISLVVAAIICYMLCGSKRASGLPPGPWGPPVLGNICQMSGDKREVFRKFRERYGDVFSIRFGKQLAVVFNGYKSIHETFVENGHLTSGRIAPFFYQYISDGGKGLFWSCGERWKKSREYATDALKYFNDDDSGMLSCVQNELTYFVEELKSQKGSPTDTHNLLFSATTNICLSLFVGRRFPYSCDEFMRIVNSVEEFTSCSQALMNLCPVLRHLPGDITQFKDSIRKQNHLMEFLKEEIMRHRKQTSGHSVKDFIDYYHEKTDPNDSDNLERDLPYILRDLILAGGNTTAILLYWGLLYLVNHPEVTNKLRKEQQKIIGTKRHLTWREKDKLPYTTATCREIKRMRCITPFSVPHRATGSIEVDDYRIPEGALLIPNMHAVLSDKDVWGDPEVFRPERFLDEQNECLCPRKELIPYFVGPRQCIGKEMAEMELFLFLSTLVREFDILPSEAGKPPPIRGTLFKTFNADRYKINLVPRPAYTI